MRPEEYIDAIYRLALGRAPDQSGLNHFRERMLSGDCPTSILKEVLESDEYQNKKSSPMEPREYVGILYHLIMGRLPDPEGLAHHASFIESGGCPIKVLECLISSPEYQSSISKRLSWPSWCDIVTILSSGEVQRPRYCTRKSDIHEWIFDSRVLTPDARVSYNLAQAIRILGAECIALVFFMGAGDYLMMNPVLSDLRKACPGVKLLGCVSSSKDAHNSPLVAELLACDPNIDEVIEYAGSPGSDDWRHYNYQDVLFRIPAKTIVIPMLYTYSLSARHRLLEFYDLFHLPKPSIVMAPQLHINARAAAECACALDNITSNASSSGKDRIAFVHVETRSSCYSYNKTDQLVKRLVDNGYFVVLVSQASSSDWLMAISNSDMFLVDPMVFSLPGSMALFRALAADYVGRFVSITTPSLFWHVSAACNVKNISLHHRHDPCVHNTHYPNIHLLSFCDYPCVPSSNITIVPPQYCEYDANGYCHYDDRIIVEAANALFEV